jgi:FKBP-type peptidyl-prolyl cis-trans isomerase SlyD
MIMANVIENGKYVELSYKVLDEKTGSALISADYPIGYIHGVKTLLSDDVIAELEGKSEGDVIEVPIDCDQLYGPRDESLVFTDAIENVPEEYREVGTTIVMENEKGDQKSFIVTRVDDKTVTVDGNNPLSGRQAKFVLKILTVREPTPEEVAAGGMVGTDVDMSALYTKQ